MHNESQLYIKNKKQIILLFYSLLLVKTADFL